LRQDEKDKIKKQNNKPNEETSEGFEVIGESEDPVQSSLKDMNKINTEPDKVLTDYYVHMTRLIPNVPDESKDTNKESKENEESKIKKQDTTETHSTNVAWLNILVGRVMFDLLRQPSWTNKLFDRVQKKLDKIKLPYFVSGLKLIEMNLGTTAPLVHQISQPKIDENGIWIEAEVTYNGSFQMTLETYFYLNKLGKDEENKLETSKKNKQGKMKAAIIESDAEDSAESSDCDDNNTDVSMTDKVLQAVVGGTTQPNASPTSPNSSMTSQTTTVTSQQRWVRMMEGCVNSRAWRKMEGLEFFRRKVEDISVTPIELTVEVIQLHGVLMLNIPPPPTDRLWYGFRDPPELQLKAYPKLGSSKSFQSVFKVDKWIERKLQDELNKLLVYPNMEDLKIKYLFANRDHR